MRFTRLGTALLACVAALAVATPAYADSAGYAGLTCGLASTNDPVLDPLDLQTGVLTFGPWEAADLVDDPTPGGSHLELAEIAWSCSIQINNATPGASVVACSGAGVGIAAGNCLVSYIANFWDNVYVCTRVQMDHDSQTQVYEEDDDTSVPGTQCALAITAQLGNLFVVTKPPRAVAVVG